ncbi:MAG: hypothetical protein GX446_04180 [Chthonomonadales bacterium]|nr:hypothetical protein [Chthonomonadales bacterium]
MSFSFTPCRQPYPAWNGPFSPARGNYSGFRFHYGQFGTWVTTNSGREFWTACGPGARAVAAAVLPIWRGGRVLLLPNGYAIKPLQDTQTGQRVLIGVWSGPVVLRSPDGVVFDLSSPKTTHIGGPWPGPDTTGLECYLAVADGSIRCTWYQQDRHGRIERTARLGIAGSMLAQGFAKCRPAESGGRVRVTANGHIITKRRERNGAWRCLYVGHIAADLWGDWSAWIGERKR